MNFRGHLYSAILVLIVASFALWRYGMPSALSPYLKVPVVLLAAGLFVIMSLFPDIDTESTIETYFFLFVIGLLIGLMVIKAYLLVAVVAILSVIPKISHHRGFTHAWWFGALISLSFLYFSPLYALASFGGFAVHKVCDW